MSRRFASIALASLVASCSESTGPSDTGVEVTVVTSGSEVDLDPNGYTLNIGNSAFTIPVNGTLTIREIPTGGYQVSLADVAPNCTSVSAQPRFLAVPAQKQNARPRVFVSVRCLSDFGTVRVTVKTIGPDPDTDGYVVLLRSKAGLMHGLPLKSGGTAEGGVPSGEFEFSVDGISTNCRVEGTQPSTVIVEHARFLDLTLSVVCVAKGSISISAKSPDPHIDADGYSYVIVQDNVHFRSGYLAPNGTVTLAGFAPGEYQVLLDGLAIHCDAPASIAAPVHSAQVTPVVFDVSCHAPSELVYVEGTAGNAKIKMIFSDGTVKRNLLDEEGPELDPAWSPDGGRIAFTRIRGLIAGISVVNADGSGRVDLTSGSAFDQHPAWSPDGREIAFVRVDGGTARIHVMNADGSNLRRITNEAALDTDPAWSPDGSRIAFTRRFGDLAPSIYVMNADGSDITRLTTGHSDYAPAWSPDGTRIAFARRDVVNGSSIQVMDASGNNRVSLVTDLLTAGDPAWSPDGEIIAFVGELDECFDYYYYNCDPQILFVRLDRRMSSLGGPWGYPVVASPSWRPRP